MAAPSPFERTATSVDGDLASARSVIVLVHDGQLTIPFARAAFVELRASLSSAPHELAAAGGAPSGTDVHGLAESVSRAAKIAHEPCLEDGCDWRSQLAAIDAARGALEEAVPSIASEASPPPGGSPSPGGSRSRGVSDASSPAPAAS